MRHLPPTGGSLCSLAAVSSAAIPVRVKLKTPLRIAAAATTLDIPTGWDPNTKKEPTGLFFAACGRPCSFDSSYGLHETATTLDIPSRWDPRANQSPTGALVAVLRTAALFDSRTGQIKNPPSECSGSYHIRHSYRMGPATTTTTASGRCREELLGQRPARRKCRPRHARMLGAATRGTKKEPTGLFFAACGRPCSFDSSYGLHETATTLDIPSRWDPRTKQQPTGLIAYPAAQGRAVRFPCGSN